MAKFQGVELSDRELAALKSGMNQPAVRKFSNGTKIFRVASEQSVTGTASKKVDGEAGNWWFGKKAFNKIMKYCVKQEQDDRELGYALPEGQRCIRLIRVSKCCCLRSSRISFRQIATY